MKKTNYTKEYGEYNTWVFHHIIDCFDLISNEVWRTITIEEQESILFGYWKLQQTQEK